MSIADLVLLKKTFFNGIAAFTRQRTSRGMPAKRTKLETGNCRCPGLHLKTNDLMDNLGYDGGVEGEPPAAAAKLRSGMHLITWFVYITYLRIISFVLWKHLTQTKTRVFGFNGQFTWGPKSHVPLMFASPNMEEAQPPNF